MSGVTANEREEFFKILDKHFAEVKGKLFGETLDELGISRALLSKAGYRAEERNEHWRATRPKNEYFEEDLRAALWIDGFTAGIMLKDELL